MHLLVDGFGGDLEKLKNQEFVYKFLDEFPSSIKMNKISGPHVTIYSGPIAEDWGVSGFVMIAESHISIHTFPDRSYTNIDIFSCKNFDEDLALSLINDAFMFQRIKLWKVGRGLDYADPKSEKTSRMDGVVPVIHT
jgi:S-adenosylmethionine decarboxylase